MEIVLNDFSIAAQFKNVEEFVDSLVEETFPVLDSLKGKGTILFKSQETYSHFITETETVYSFLCSRKFFGFPEAQKLRTLLGSLMDEPYWEWSSKTEQDAVYFCNHIGEFLGNSPNCFSEALERDGLMVSFYHPEFQTEEFEIFKNAQKEKIRNLFDKKSAGKAMFLKNCMGFSELLLSGWKGQDIIFYSKNNKYYADECFDNGQLSQKDVESIQEDFLSFITGRENGTVLRRFSDSISYRDLTYNEFRTTLANSREFRLFYYIDGAKMVFFNTLIKTTQTTPNHVKEKTYLLIKQYKKERAL